MSDSKDEIINKILFIKRNINEMITEELRDILQIIMNSNIDDKKIQEKGGGTQIKFKDIPIPVINDIFDYISKKIKEKVDKLAEYTHDI
jgi:hypothetical protein